MRSTSGSRELVYSRLHHYGFVWGKWYLNNDDDNNGGDINDIHDDDDDDDHHHYNRHNDS